MYIFYKIYLQWIYWTLFFIARCSTIFASDLPEPLPHINIQNPTYDYFNIQKYINTYLKIKILPSKQLCQYYKIFVLRYLIHVSISMVE